MTGRTGRAGNSAAAALLLVLLGACQAPEGTGPAAAGDAPAAPSPSDPASPLPPPPSVPPPPVTEVLGPDPAGPSAPGVLRVGAGGAELATAPGGAPVGRLRAGVVVPYTQVRDGWARIVTPCSLARWLPVDQVEPLLPPAVVIDPGHGGEEAGAEGPSGLLEKDVNLEVAARAASELNRLGVPAVLTRTGDYRATLEFRSRVAEVAGVRALVSVHHNADPDGPRETPGTETFYQRRSQESRRLAGLLYEEVTGALSALNLAWVGDTDAGAKWRLNSRGGDYYGILRMPGGSGVTAVLAELAYVSNAPEEAWLGSQDAWRIEGEAVARGIARWLQTDDPGSGFSTPYPRRAPAGPGGGLQGCVDPA